MLNTNASKGTTASNLARRCAVVLLFLGAGCKTNPNNAHPNAATITAPKPRTSNLGNTSDPVCGTSDKKTGLTKQQLEQIEEHPASAVVTFARYKNSSASLSHRLAYETAAWLYSNKKNYEVHLQSVGLDPGDERILCTHFTLASLAAKARTGGLAAMWFGAWQQHQQPHKLSPEEQRVTLAVLAEILNIDNVGAFEVMVRAILRMDPTAGFAAKFYVQSLDGFDLIPFLKEMRSKYPHVKWVAEIAADIPQLATIGDLKDPVLRAKLLKTMVELGGVSQKNAQMQMDNAHEEAKAYRP